ncbi:MAG: YciI family protein, partial [Caulobacteraceae bacterium]
KGNELLEKTVAEHNALAGELISSGAMKIGAGLKGTDTATTIRADATGRRTIHDGPFAETREQLGGFYLIEAPDLDAAIAIARRIPLPGGGSIEIRPTIEGDA